MKKGGGEKGLTQAGKTRAAKAPRAPKAPKAPPPTPEIVAARLRELFASGGPPALWKDAELKKRLATAERPLLAAALGRLRQERQVLALTQGKGVFYLFAGPLRSWLADGGGEVESLTPDATPGSSPEDVFAVYERLVRESGGFPDLKIASLRAALDTATAGTLSGRLVEWWREGRATLSLGDWSLADAATRAAAVELNGERYLLVRLEKDEG